MKYWFVLFLILALILSPIVINIQHYFIYSDSPFLTPQFESVKAKDILVKYFNYSSYDEIYVIAKGNYSQILHQVNLTAEEYLRDAKVLTPYQFINDTLKPYYKFTQNIINKTFQSLLTLHNIYLNLTLERESILQNFSYFLFQLNVTYGIPLHEFYSNSKVALQFIAIYSKLNGSQLERARNSSLIVFHNPYILLFSFNNYSDEKLVEETIENFSNYSLLVYYLTGRNISNFALEYPYNYSLQLVEKEFPKPPISLSTFHKNDTWLIIVEVPSNESLTNVENFMAHLNYTVTGHLPIYAESALATESDLRIIDIVTVLLLSILLIVLIRALVPILVLITSAVIGLEIAYTTLYVLTFFGYSIYYISGLVIPPIVFGITVDYSILFLYRFFEEYRKGYSKEIALKRAFKNSGRALLFSGLSITIGFASFILSPSPLLRNIGIALVTSSISSLIPSILFTYSVLGVIPVNMLKFPRKEVPNPVDVRRKYLEKVSNRAIKYKFLVLVLIILTGVASYIIFISHTTNVSVSEIVPKNSEVLTGERELKTFFNYSVDYIILEGNPNSSYSRIYNLSNYIISIHGFVFSPSAIGDKLIQNKTFLSNFFYSHNYTLIEAFIPYPVFSNGAINVTEKLISEGYLVGGSNAERINIVDNTVHDYYSYVLPLTIVSITVYLFIVLGSLVVPVRLSLTLLVSALFGVAVMFIIFGQVYWLSPLIVFAIMYSLGIDYDMFIIIRILEEEGSEEERIVKAISNTGLVVTAAGLILAGALLSLGSADMRFLQEIGITVGITILFDTFIVRPIFVPAIMSILKKYNWWPRVRDEPYKG